MQNPEPHGVKPSTTCRILLYFASHMSQQHLAYMCLRCWLSALQHAPVLQTADVLIYAGASLLHSPTKNSTRVPTCVPIANPNMEAEGYERLWTATVHAFLNRNVTYVRSSFNPGHQEGAKFGMYIVHCYEGRLV